MPLKNIVTAGDYKGYIDYKNKKKGLYIYGSFGLGKKVFINKETVERYEVVGEDQYQSFGSSVARATVGGALFGVGGAVAGAASGKKKGIHTVSIIFKDGTKCLCDLDDFMFKMLTVTLY